MRTANVAIIPFCLFAIVTQASAAWADEKACREALVAGNEAVGIGELQLAETSYAAGIEAGDVEEDLCLIEIQGRLAALYARQVRLTEEAQIVEARLALRRRVLGADHPDLMVEAHDLAGLYLELREPGLAAPYMEDVLVFDIERFGPQSPAVADAHLFIALLYEDAGDLATAADFYRRALAIYIGFLPSCHADIVRVQAGYGAVLAQLGKTEKSLALEAQARSACQSP